MRRAARLSALVSMVWLSPLAASANGRMPGANDLALNESDPAHLVARATFGILQSRDAGGSWSWICEQAIDVSGVIADPPLGLMADGTLVLLPPTGSALVSRDGGCDWERVGAPLMATRGVDLTLDPSDGSRLLVLTSAISEVDDQGFGRYENLLVETRDNAQNFRLLASLPNDIEAETVEIAKSDSQRIYVSGTDAFNPRLGVILRSDDGGENWLRSTLSLPAGSGALFISAIHPTDADRIYVRVPSRGDTIGLLPARLYFSTDKGETFQQIGATNKGMFGLALSPDGDRLAYGGPNDGLYVGPSDGSSAFEKRNALGVRCLRWLEGGSLYLCGSEPADPFSLGVSDDDGVSFRPLYKLADTCPAACTVGSSFANSCQQAWGPVRKMISAPADMCSVAWARPAEGELDAGAADSGADADVPSLDDASDAPTTRDAGDDSAAEDDTDHRRADSGCACNAVSPNKRGGALLGASLLLGLLARRRNRRRHPPADRRFG